MTSIMITFFNIFLFFYFPIASEFACVIYYCSELFLKKRLESTVSQLMHNLFSHMY